MTDNSNKKKKKLIDSLKRIFEKTKKITHTNKISNELIEIYYCDECGRKCKLHRKYCEYFTCNVLLSKMICPECGAVRYCDTYKAEIPDVEDLEDLYLKS